MIYMAHPSTPTWHKVNPIELHCYIDRYDMRDPHAIFSKRKDSHTRTGRSIFMFVRSVKPAARTHTAPDMWRALCLAEWPSLAGQHRLLSAVMPRRLFADASSFADRTSGSSATTASLRRSSPRWTCIAGAPSCCHMWWRCPRIAAMVP